MPHARYTSCLNELTNGMVLTRADELYTLYYYSQGYELNSGLFGFLGFFVMKMGFLFLCYFNGKK